MNQSSGFLPAFLRGTAIAAATGVGLALSIVIAGLGDKDNAGDAIATALVTLMVAGLATFGAPFTGALTGIVAGRRSTHRGMASLAGLAAGAAGQLVVLVLVFGTATVALSSDATSSGGFTDADTNPLDWGGFWAALLFLVPAAATAALVALVTAWPTQTGPAATRTEAAAPAPAPGPVPTGNLRKAACPRCKTIVTYAAGTKPVCSACGFGS